MSLFLPNTQPTGVGLLAPVIVAVPIPAGYRQHRLAKIVVQHQAGSLHFYSACFSTDPAVADPLLEIACYDNQLPLSRLSDDNKGQGFSWDGAETQNWSADPVNVYCKLGVDLGTDNSFRLGVYVDEVG